MKETLIDFMRHGEPEGGRRYRGHGVDDPLSDRGWQQMWNAVAEPVPWQRVVTSPLQRCRVFALALAEKHRLPLAVEQRFQEVGQGVWEGLSPDQIVQRDPAAYAAFHHDPVRNRPPGAESLDVFGKRVADALEALFCDCAGEHVLVVAHAGVIRAALGHVLQADPLAWYRVRVDNAALTRFRRGPYGDKLEFHNRPSLG